VRRAQRGNVRRPAPSSRLLIPATAKASVADKRVEHAFARRLAQAAEILQPGTTVEGDEMLPVFEDALASSSTSDRAKAWLSLVAADGTYPEERGVERMARILRMDGPQGVGRELSARFARSAGAGRAPMTELDVLRERIVVDVTHTASASDLHTGIQRVVRETVSRWLAAGYAFDLIRFDREPTAARRLTNDERERFKGWRRYVGSEVAASRSEGTKILVPWECDLVVPELPFETHRTSAYRGLIAGSILRSLSMVGYDVIPIVAAEKVVPQVTTDFAGYLSVVKHADRLSAISRTSKDSFAAFATMAAAAGPRMVRVEAHELRTEAPELDAACLSSARARLDIGPGPVVLVVGSHEPRKNHLTVLEAAERLWQRGDSFELVFLGWSGWLSEEFDELVDKLVLNGRSIVVRKRCSEDDLWAAYRLARFTVFPSLLEGYGLPIAESLASGTPVITSNYGSMAEVAALGGSLQVDPRDPDALERAMGRLLEDGAELERLREEARSSDTGTWESYAERLWVFLIGAP
jgi:glycosyltransferase involved in cell wall biosynthesis